MKETQALSFSVNVDIAGIQKFLDAYVQEAAQKKLHIVLAAGVDAWLAKHAAQLEREICNALDAQYKTWSEETVTKVAAEIGATAIQELVQDLKERRWR